MNSKTLRKIYNGKLENVYSAIKHTNSRMKYDKYNISGTYIYEETEHYTTYYFSEFEKKFDLYLHVVQNIKINNIPINKLKNFFEQHKINKKKIYKKNNSMITYYYDLPITNKIIICNGEKIFHENTVLTKQSDVITYEFNIYIYPNCSCTNDGVDINSDAMRYSPDWFYYVHNKKNYGRYGSYFIKNNNHVKRFGIKKELLIVMSEIYNDVGIDVDMDVDMDADMDMDMDMDNDMDEIDINEIENN
jgi:hypothetical protein